MGWRCRFGDTLVRNTYEGSVLIRQTFPNGEIYRYYYVWSANAIGHYAAKVVITMPDGSKKEVDPTDSVSMMLRKQ